MRRRITAVSDKLSDKLRGTTRRDSEWSRDSYTSNYGTPPSDENMPDIINSKKEGWLTKRGNRLKTWKRRWFRLINNELYYYKSHKDEYHVGKISLNEAMIETSSMDDKENGFSINTRARVLFLFADTEEAMASWMNALLISTSFNGVSQSRAVLHIKGMMNESCEKQVLTALKKHAVGCDVEFDASKETANILGNCDTMDIQNKLEDLGYLVYIVA